MPLVTTLYKAYYSTLLRLMHLQTSEGQLITCGVITQIARLAMLLILQSTSCFPLYVYGIKTRFHGIAIANV